MKRKNIIVLVVILVLVVSGTFIALYSFSSRLNSKNITNSDETVALKEKPTYLITQPVGKHIYVQSTNLVTTEKNATIDSAGTTNSIEQTYELSYSVIANKLKSDLSNTSNEDIDFSSSQTFEKEYVEFVPYSKITSNKIGLIIMTDSNKVLSDIKKNPTKAKDYLEDGDVALEQSIDIR